MSIPSLPETCLRIRWPSSKWRIQFIITPQSQCNIRKFCCAQFSARWSQGIPVRNFPGFLSSNIPIFQIAGGDINQLILTNPDPNLGIRQFLTATNENHLFGNKIVRLFYLYKLENHIFHLSPILDGSIKHNFCTESVAGDAFPDNPTSQIPW
jgi:hypothetical protein